MEGRKEKIRINQGRKERDDKRNKGLSNEGEKK